MLTTISGKVRATLALGAACLLLAGLAACGGGAADEPQSEVAEERTETSGPLRIGVLHASFNDEIQREMLRAFDLAIQHLNEAGGVFGQPVQVEIVEAATDPDLAVQRARQLVEDNPPHAIVGGWTSATALPLAEQVTAPAGIPMISPSATSPLLSTADDQDFLFRTIPVDSAGASVLAQLVRDQGFTNIGVIYRDDAWGSKYAEVFEAAWEGPIRVVGIDPAQASYLDALRESAAGGAEALVPMTFNAEGIVLLREALDNGIYDEFVLTGPMKDPRTIEALGSARLGGMHGIAAVADRMSASSVAWEEAYVAEHDALPVLSYVKETYDATIALALAAQAAGSTDGAAIRDQLRAVTGGPGEAVIAGPEGIRRALELLAGGGAINYEGASTTLDWDENGDLLRGQIGVWRFTQDGQIEEVRVVPFGG